MFYILNPFIWVHVQKKIFLENLLYFNMWLHEFCCIKVAQKWVLVFHIPWLSRACFILTRRFGSFEIFLSQHCMAHVTNSFLYLVISASAVLTPILSLISSWHIWTHLLRLDWNCSSSDWTYCWAFWAGAEHLSTHLWT